MTVYLNSASTKDLTGIKEDLNRYLDYTFPEDVSVKISGAAIAQEALTWRLVESALRSISISVVLVFLVLLVTYRSLPVSLIGSFSIALTILINFGIMGITGIALDISTAMVGSIAIGIGIDYVIHFLNAYSLGLNTNEDVEDAFRYAYRTTGKAIVFNAISVAAGFAVLGFSSFLPLMYLGVLVAITMAVSSLSALTVVPAMLYGFGIKIKRNNGGTKE